MTDDIENIKSINKHIYNLLDSKDQAAADRYFYFEISKKYQQDVAEHFNDSNWLHYNLLDDAGSKSTFARTMLNLNSELELEYNNENEFSAALAPFIKISHSNDVFYYEDDEDDEDDDDGEDDDENDDNDYVELLKFKKDMLTFFGIAIGTSLAVATTYLFKI